MFYIYNVLTADCRKRKKHTKLKYISFLIIALCTSLGTWARALPDTIAPAAVSQKNFYRAAGTITGFNGGLWAFDRYVLKGPYAYISARSMRTNISKGFVWDTDKMNTNFFGHPYTGNLYFNSARSNGFNYWQSALFALGGSAMWEVLLENEYPSANDITATPIGGAAIGEVAHRLTDAMTDDRLSGSARAEREAFMFLLNPMRGFTRLLTGQLWRVSDNPGRLYPQSPLNIQLSTGARGLFTIDEGRTDHSVGALINIAAEYGDRFGPTRRPYDYFTAFTTISIMRRQPILARAHIRGRLFGAVPVDNDLQKLSVGMYQNYDFYDSDTISSSTAIPFKLAIPASVGFGVMHHTEVGPDMAVDSEAHINVVGLAASLTDHFRVDNRNYNFASGFSTHINGRLTVASDKAYVAVAASFYRLYTWGGYDRATVLRDVNPHEFNVMGDNSNTSLVITELNAQTRLLHNLAVGTRLEYYYRRTRYRDFAAYTGRSFVPSLYLSYTIGDGALASLR